MILSENKLNRKQKQNNNEVHYKNLVKPFIPYIRNIIMKNNNFWIEIKIDKKECSRNILKRKKYEIWK